MRTIQEFDTEQRRNRARLTECPKGEKFITELFPDGFAHHQMELFRQRRWNDWWTRHYGISRCKNCGHETEEFFCWYP